MSVVAAGDLAPDDAAVIGAVDANKLIDLALYVELTRA
jgi:hypothetical protein